jgi:hypothetical protein
VAGAQDGTVLMGVNLFSLELSRGLGLPDYKSNINAAFAPVVIMAHEFGHIMQFKSGLSPSGPWQMEPHADFMAGWLLHRVASIMVDGQKLYNQDMIWRLQQTVNAEAMLEEAAKSIFEKGDTLFNDPAHHGQPEFRAAMVRAGYDAGRGIRKGEEDGGFALIRVKRNPCWQCAN